MADPKGPERETSGASPGARPKAPPLDLSATDVTPKAAPAAASPANPKGASASQAKGPDVKDAEIKSEAKPASPAAPSQTAARDPKLDAAPTPSAAAASAGSTASSSSAAGASSGAGPSSAAQGRATAMGASAKPPSSVPSSSAAPKPSSSTVPPSPAPSQRSGGGVGVLGAGLAGLIGAALAIAVIALFGRELLGTPQPDMSRVTATESKLDAVGRDLAALRERPAPTLDTGAIDARIAELGKAVEGSGARAEALESEIRALATRAPAVQVDTGAVDAIGQRVDALGPRLDGLDAQIKDAAKAGDLAQVTEAVEGLRSRIDGSIAAGLKPLEDKIAALEAELKARPVGDPAARLVVALGAVDQALAAGRPFADELAAVKAAGGDVAGLEAAASGAPTTAALAAELAGIMAGLPPVRANESASVFQRFVANAGSIVKVTPAEAPAGGGPSEARQRVAAKAEAGDVAGALAERQGLDDAAKAATEGWAQKAQARIAAGEALESARTAALARLGSN